MLAIRKKGFGGEQVLERPRPAGNEALVHDTSPGPGGKGGKVRLSYNQSARSSSQTNPLRAAWAKQQLVKYHHENRLVEGYEVV